MNPTLNPEQIEALQSRLAKNPGIVLEQLADSLACPLQTVIECLPNTLWQKMAGSQFVPLLDMMHAWHSSVTVISNSNDAILEFTGPLPYGEVSHGFYNWKNSTGLHGHLRFSQCSAIYWIERPFMNKPTACLIFCNLNGDPMFKIFVGRNEAGELRQDQLDALRQFAAQYCELA
ncbi:heme utilization cystosolic carrier protein HutX [uncultured Deefgea sp.]|uniref:heme utilization cystosolic carrier protein HutX n=1 Tax=uncultured Deefgea sp. TaxID=1304914 RepID=UPI0027E46B0C|nr:heme utilization cystosolic carrier protein HutX [uncultured Deefgea sp.]